jgi:O-antigen ligase
MKDNSQTLKVIDKTILVFAFIFFASLTNSIFLNQIGYYGALLFMLIRFGVSKKNPFPKTGLEIFFLLFLTAELLSAIFSVEPHHAFNLFIRRLLLIPTVYVIYYVSTEEERAKKFVKIFIIFSVLSSGIYLWDAYSFYIRGLFQLTGSGPFLFHYPITTSELFSFTAIILFAFFFDEELNVKKKWLVGFFFLITLFSLLATFKRTGWIGFIVGILIILIYKKKYLYLALFLILIVAAVLVEKSKSEVIFISSNGNKFVKEMTIETKSQALDLNVHKGQLWLADYNDGLLEFNGSKFKPSFKAEKPVVSFKNWKDDYYVAELVDTRFLLLKKDGEKFFKLGEFFSAGYTKDFGIIKKELYVLDVDSGLTVFSNPGNLREKKIYPQIKNFKKILKFKNFVGFFSKAEGVVAFNLENDLPNKQIFKFKDKNKVLFAEALNDTLFIQTRNRIGLVNLNTEQPSFVDLNPSLKLREVYGLVKIKRNLYLITLGGNYYSTDYPLQKIFKLHKEFNLGFNPKSFAVYRNKIVFTYVKRNRFTTIFDPNMPSNATRISLWTAGVKMFLDHPLFGVGDIDLAKLYKQYKKPYEKEIQGHLHNDYFHFLAILGAVGFLAVMLLLWKIFVVLVQSYRETESVPFVSSFNLGALAVFVSFLVEGLFEWNFGDHEIITFIWFVLGMALAFHKAAGRKSES